MPREFSTTCPHDMDGDGNCHLHPRGCPDRQPVVLAAGVVNWPVVICRINGSRLYTVTVRNMLQRAIMRHMLSGQCIPQDWIDTHLPFNANAELALINIIEGMINA